MHSDTKRLRAALLIAATVLLMAACGIGAESAAAPGDDDQAGTDVQVDPTGPADADPQAGTADDSGIVHPAADNGGKDDGSGPVEPEPRITEGQPDLGRPDDVVPDVRQQLDEAGATGRWHGGELLDVAETVDQAPPPDQAIGLRDGRSRNEAGELNRLDEAAALACGDIERGLTALDDGDRQGATDMVASAADRAARSTVDDIEAWSTSLTESVDADTESNEALAPLVGFLSVCTRGGYEL